MRLSEVRWLAKGEYETVMRETLIYSRNNGEVHQTIIDFLLCKQVKESLLYINHKIETAKFYTQ